MVMMLFGCKAEENPAPTSLGENEFVVTHKAAVSEDQLRTIFESVVPFNIISSTPKMTVIRFNRAVELENLEKIVESSDLLDAVQPNYRYQKLR